MTKSLTTQPEKRNSGVSQPGTTKPATANHKHTTHNSTLLQISLVTGSVFATILGTNLLASSDANAANGAMAGTTITTTQAENSGTTTESVAVNPALILAPIPTVFLPGREPATAAAGTTANGVTATIANTAVQLDLDAIPEVVVPNLPVAIEQSNINLADLLPAELPTIPTVQQETQQATQQSSQASSPVSRSRSSR